MMVKGYIQNNSGRSKHIYKRTVYPGQKVDLGYIQKVVEKKVPEGKTFVEWLEDNLPKGWEVNVIQTDKADVSGGRPYKEVLTAKPEVASGNEVLKEKSEKTNGQLPDDDDKRPSIEYSTPRAIDRMTARDIYSLRLKDNPKRIIKNVNSIHKLRRALAMCKNDSRKTVITRLIQQRIRELNITL